MFHCLGQLVMLHMLYTLSQVLKKTVHKLSMVSGHSLKAAKEALFEKMSSDYSSSRITKHLY